MDISSEKSEYCFIGFIHCERRLDLAGYMFALPNTGFFFFLHLRFRFPLLFRSRLRLRFRLHLCIRFPLLFLVCSFAFPLMFTFSFRLRFVSFRLRMCFISFAFPFRFVPNVYGEGNCILIKIVLYFVLLICKGTVCLSSRKTKKQVKFKWCTVFIKSMF